MTRGPSAVHIAALLLLGAAPPEKPQYGGSAETQERLVGLAIDRIEMIAAPRENKDELLAITKLEVGKPYDTGEVRRAVELLYQLDRFDNVYVSAARVQNGVYLQFVLPPRPRVREVNIVSDVLSNSEIQEAIDLRIGAELDARTLAKKRERIAMLLRRLGYRSPAIGIATERVDLNGNFDVTLRIDEGPRTRLRRMLFVGAPERPVPWLKGQINLRPGDVVNLKQVDEALARVGEAYRRHGYYDVRIGDPEVRPTAQRIAESGDPLADLVIFLDAGPKVTLRFVGHHAVSLRELKDAASIMEDKGVGSGPSAITEVSERIKARYERRGYWQAELDPKIKLTHGGHRKEIVFDIKEGRGSYVATLRFPGAKAFTEKALREQVDAALENTLSEEVGRPGADPRTVAEAIGDASQERRAPWAPDTSSPNISELYVPRAYRAAKDAIEDLYRGEGYLDVEVEAPVVRARENSDLVDITIPIREGVRWMLGAVSFFGNESVSSQKLLELSGLDLFRPGGEPLPFSKIEDASRAIVGYYRDEGYLYARISEDLREIRARGTVENPEYVHTSTSSAVDLRSICRAAVAANKPTCEVELVFRIIEGPEVRTRSIVVHGVEKTNESLVRGEISIEEGFVLRESDMAQTRLNLLRLGVFDRVSVRPNDEQQEAADKDVVVDLSERKPEFVEVGAGVSTDEGTRLFASYSHGNVLGTALRFNAAGKVYYNPFLVLYPEEWHQQIDNFYGQFTPIQHIQGLLTAGVAYPQIFGFPRGLGAGIDATVFHQYSPAYVQNTGTTTLNVNYKGFRPQIFGTQRPITVIMKGTIDHSILKCNNALLQTTTSSQTGTPCSADQHLVHGSTTYAIVGPTIRFDLTDDPVNPHAGVFFEVGAEYGKGIESGSPDFGRLEGKGSVFFPLGARSGFATSLRFGRLIRIASFGEIPINRRYFAGGGSTIRGFPEQGLFPYDVSVGNDKISTGGLVLLTWKNELRFPIIGALGGALFWDFGNLYENFHNIDLDPAKLRQGVGFGLRFETPVGPLTLDFGVPLKKATFPSGAPLPGETCSFLPLGTCPSFSVRSF